MTSKARFRRLLVAALAVASAPALAQTNAVELNTEVRVARTVTAADGSTQTRYEAPNAVVPGDQLRFYVRYANRGAQPATNFEINNPLPAQVSYVGNATGGGLVSVDGGRTFGALTTLKLRAADGTERPATPADVTHVRWRLASPIAPGGTGELSFDGAVR